MTLILKNIAANILLVIFLALIPLQSKSQNIPFGHFSVQEGLSNSVVNCLLQDRTGFIWFGTDDGLNRFDGYEVKVYRNDPNDNSSISENIIWALAEDQSGNLWIGTKSGGLNKYDPLTNKFLHWEIDSASVEEVNITYIYEDSKNNIWIGTYRNGLYRFNPSQNKFEHWQNSSNNPDVLSNNYITSVVEDSRSNIWIATYAGLDKFIPEEINKPFKRITSDFKYPIWYLTESTFIENTIWMGTFSGLFNFDPVNESFSKIILPESSGLKFGNSVSSIAEEYYLGEKILWVGTYGGLVQINLSTGLEKRFLQTKKSNPEIVSNQIHDLIIDRSGVVWIATENGLNFYSQKLSKFNLVASAMQLSEILQQLSGKNVRAVTQTTDESLWFGTSTGLFGVKNTAKDFTIIQNSEFMSLNVWSLFKGSSANLWIGTYGQGLKELNLKTNELKSRNVRIPDFNSPGLDYVKTIFEADDGMIWIGFWGGGLARLNPLTSNLKHWHNETDNPFSLSYNDVWTVFEDRKGRIWVGTNGGGLNLFNEETEGNFYCWNTKGKNNQRLISNSIYTIYESAPTNSLDDKTILWLGTANGLHKFVVNNDSGSSDGSKLDVEVKHYTVESGLPDNAIESILEDENGNLWIGTSTGISFFNASEEHFTNFTVADGLSGSTFNSSAAFKTAEGIMLFGCTSGLNYFDPDKIKQSTYSPPVVLTDFQIFNQPAGSKNLSSLNSAIFNSKEVTLSYNQNDFSFEFTSLDYNAPEENEYAYYLEGFDEEWIYSGKRRFVTYTNLDPGEYVFQVKATNSDGLWNEQPAKIFIVINPPFWATWWAYTIYAIAFIGGLYLIRATEIKRRKKKEDERLRRQKEEAQLREAELKAKNIEQEKEIEKQKIRNRIAQDLHDEIGSNLSSISLMSELIQNDEKINQEASEKIKRIHKVAKGSTQAMRDIVWLTNPASDSLKDLIAKMKEVADNILGKFNLNFDYPKVVSDINLLPETKRNIFFIYKEALNNIVKHAEAKSVEINFQIEDGTIFLSIKDDGKGFNAAASESGNGLKNIKSRAKEINADLRFESHPGKGTFLELTAHITQVRD
jgi:signal transduction histidine kinase/ligand-binding sensor domain-containing protein